MLATLPDDGNRYEVIDGDLIVTPAPSYAHQRIVRILATLLQNYLASSTHAEVMLAPAEVRAGEHTSVEPDLFVLPLNAGLPVAGPAALGDLLLTIEVVSPSTAGIDRYRKRPLYHREGIPECWIVDPDGQFVERWRFDAGEPEVVRHVIEWQEPHAAQSVIINLDAVFAQTGRT
jgi:Uma2 family endonuclease